MNNTSAILSGTAFLSGLTMLQKILNILKGLIRSLVAMLTLPYLLTHRLSAHMTFASFNTFSINKLSAPLFIFQPLYRLFLIIMGKFDQFRLKIMTMVRFTTGILSKILTSCPTPFGNIAVQFSIYGRRMNTNFLTIHFFVLFQS